MTSLRKLGLIAVLFIIGFFMTSSSKIPQPTTIPNLPIDTVKPVYDVKPRKVPRRGSLYTFMHRIGKVEGLGSYQRVSRSGYLGLYQFHPKTLQSMGFNVDRDQFLTDSTLQDSAMIAYMRMNARELNREIKTFSGTYYNGVYITKSGILAGAHLVGSAGVLAFFYPNRYSYRTVDGNGIHVSQYMEKFAGYDLRGL